MGARQGQTYTNIRQQRSQVDLTRNQAAEGLSHETASNRAHTVGFDSDGGIRGTYVRQGKSLGGTTVSAPHGRVLDYEIAASDTISGVNAKVKCDATGSINVNATADSGASSKSGSSGLIALTADVPQVVDIGISPSVTISGQACDAVVTVRN